MMKQTYSFDDVLLVPQYSKIESRSEINIGSKLDARSEFELPVISSPMDTVTESAMAARLCKSGGLGILHRYNSIAEQVLMAEESVRLGATSLAAAVGATGDYVERAQRLVDAGARFICIDIAHGHHSLMRTALRNLRSNVGDGIHIMAGNVATLGAFEDLADWGADSVRVGIGGGSICSTRIVTGHGIPTLQSILDCARTSYDTKIIADGGIKTSGDIVKALAAGADFVMVGSMLAGTDETPGEVLHGSDGQKFKEYRGMASREAQRSWRGKSSSPEGVATMVPYRGPVEDILEDLAGGIRSGLSYTGVHSIGGLQGRAHFILQSSAAQLESNTHILWRK